ncbi:phage regulatory CII family protein [Hoeflea sp. TYP-13]|uniref:phage regulatory CII family protein n=1 Tax=Hoeflea sp. TYP-13 TaxID=3230023 RepID=UPI0034C6126D
MSTGRGLSKEEAARVIKTALRRATRLYGGAVGLSIDLELSQSHLSKCQNPNEREILPAHLLLVIDSLIGSPVIIDAMARELGYRLVRQEATEECSLDMSDLLRFVGVSGDLAQKFSQFLADGEIDNAEAPVAHAIIELVISHLRTMQDKLPGGGR